MALTEKDLLARAPAIKKPKTLNPLGAVFYALMMGGGHTLFYNSFVRTKYVFGIGFVGIFLVILGTFFLLVASSLSTKTILFTTMIEKTKSISAQTALQIVYFYIGFLPIYGFSIVYFQESLELWHILVVSSIVVVLFALTVILNVQLMKKDQARIRDLKKLLYQPRKALVISLCLLITIIVTVILLAF